MVIHLAGDRYGTYIQLLVSLASSHGCSRSEMLNLVYEEQYRIG